MTNEDMASICIVDLLRACCCFFAFNGHVHVFMSDYKAPLMEEDPDWDPWQPLRILSVVAMINAVNVFFLLSGYFTALGNNPTVPLATSIARRWRRLIPFVAVPLAWQLLRNKHLYTDEGLPDAVPIVAWLSLCGNLLPHRFQTRWLLGSGLMQLWSVMVDFQCTGALLLYMRRFRCMRSLLGGALLCYSLRIAIATSHEYTRTFEMGHMGHFHALSAKFTDAPYWFPDPAPKRAEHMSMWNAHMYMGTPGRATPFFVGAALAHATRQQDDGQFVATRWRYAIGAMVALALAVGTVASTLEPSVSESVVVSFMQELIGPLLVAGALFRYRKAEWRLANSAATAHVAKVSGWIYALHWSMLVEATRAFPAQHDAVQNTALSCATFPVVVAVSTCVHAIERALLAPPRRLLNHHKKGE